MSDRSHSTPPTVAPPLSIPEAGTLNQGVFPRWQCPRCGGTDLAAAYPVDYSDKFRQLQLAPRALKLSKISRLLRPFRRMVNISAVVCRRCGLVLFEVDPDELAEAERRFGRR